MLQFLYYFHIIICVPIVPLKVMLERSTLVHVERRAALQIAGAHLHIYSTINIPTCAACFIINMFVN